MSYRRYQPLEDHLLLETALDDWEAQAPKYGYVDYPNRDKVLANIYNKHLEDDAYIVDSSFLLLVESITPWFADDKILQEVLVLRLRYGGRLASVISAIEDIAYSRGDDKILLSDSSVGLSLSKFYKRKGYSLVTNSFFKDKRWVY